MPIKNVVEHYGVYNLILNFLMHEMLCIRL